MNRMCAFFSNEGLCLIMLPKMLKYDFLYIRINTEVISHMRPSRFPSEDALEHHLNLLH